MQEAGPECPLRAAANVDDRPRANPSLQNQIERLRVSELFRFFEPLHQFNAATEGVEGGGIPRIATDASLTAFAQLAALRLGCQRCFISLIDDSKQYIVAEATQSISLESEQVYDEEDDKLSFGQTVLDFATGVCPGTIACFSSLDNSLDQSTTYVKASRSYYIMNDMSQLEGYKNRSYVSGWPHMRYYAEVPIHSPAGYTIGTVCVVDNKAREGLDMKGLTILQEIAKTVMSHLELCISKVQGKQAERMIQALGQFVQGHDSVRDLWLEKQSSRLPDPSMRHLTVEKQAEQEFGLPLLDSSHSMSPIPASQDSDSLKQEESRTSFPDILEDVGDSNLKEKENLPPSTDVTPGGNSILIERNISSTKHNILQSRPGSTSFSHQPNISTHEAIKDQTVTTKSRNPDSLETILRRAANLVREAIALDGVVFFDPLFRSGQSAPDTTTNQNHPGVKEHASGSIDQMTRDRRSSSAFLSSRMISCSSTDHQTTRTAHLQETLLDKLLTQFRYGGVMTFDNESVTRAVRLDVRALNSKFSSSLENSPFGTNTENSIKAGTWSVADVAELKTVFGDVASLMIYPVWDSNRDKHVAYCMVWSSSPARIFRQQDVTYLTSFSNSIIAQLAKMETIAADQAKNAFISSISHELRSPLHGIMASMELLRDSIPGTSHHDVLDLVESCGSALLDTINNVLAFSEANREAFQSHRNLISQPPDDVERSLVRAVDMEKLVEDVSSICLMGSQYSTNGGSTSAPPKTEHFDHSTSDSGRPAGAVVICDVSPVRSNLFQVDRAVWKRVLMNLLGNSLKYTTSGFIIVKFAHEPLSSEADSSKAACSKAVLTVEDSGKGMSQNYLEHHLYKPFHQENPLAPGTGLGLSIVSRLVQSIGGRIHVSSEENVGTKVQVTVDLKSTTVDPAKVSKSRNALKGLRIGFFDLNATSHLETISSGIVAETPKAALALRAVITKYASSWGILPITVASIDAAEVDILVVEDFQYQSFSTPQLEALQRPVVVLRTNTVLNNVSVTTTNTVLFNSPFGPRGFERVLLSCLMIRDEITASEIPANHLSRDFTLPIRSKAITTHSSPLPQSRFEQEEQLKASKSAIASVLLVEDNSINMKLLVACVTKMGHSFISSINGAEAVDAYIASAGEIKLVFMDIQMPIMDGMEAMRKIREHEQAHSLPPAYIVALTALGSMEDKQIALDAGADMFLTKPVSLRALKDIVREHHKLSD